MSKLGMLILLPLIANGCHRPIQLLDSQRETAVFQFYDAANQERFRARTSNPELIRKAREELSQPLGERSLHPNGALIAGDGGVNMPWRWSYDESEWQLVELSMELCDAKPSYVEANLENWLKEVGSFCPWGSQLEKEIFP